MKFLFNDGSGKIRELSSKEELDYYISISPDKNKCRIWLYRSSHWIGYEEYLHWAATNRSQWNGQHETVKPVPVVEKSPRSLHPLLLLAGKKSRAHPP